MLQILKDVSCKLRKYKLKDIKNIKKIPLNLHTFLIGFSILGFLGVMHMVFLTSRNFPVGKPISPPAASPFQNFIAAEGIIEAKADNVSIGCLTSGIVKNVVDVGTKVKVGEPLFTLDQRQANADLKLKQQQVEQTESALKQAEAVMLSSKAKYDIAKKITDKRAISKDDYLSRENAYLVDSAAYATAEKSLNVAKAQLHISQTNMEILTVNSPIDGTVLQVNIRPGEYASNQQQNQQQSILLLGALDEMQIRADIDENEAWRYKNGAKAIAYVRGNSKIKFDLVFDHVEPYVLPKVSLTGSSAEKVDVRVLQVIYRFANNHPNVYVGQQVDVYIDVTEDTKDAL